MESRPHGRDLQAPIYPLPDGSIERNIGLIEECEWRNSPDCALPCYVKGLWQASATKDCGYRSAQ